MNGKASDRKDEGSCIHMHDVLDRCDGAKQQMVKEAMPRAWHQSILLQ